MVLTLAILGILLPFHQQLKARLPDGVLGLVYLGVYAVGRFFLSFYRTDPAVFAGLRQAQLASLLMVVLAMVAIPLLYRRARWTAKPLVAEPAVNEPVVEEPVVAEPETAAVAAPAPATPGRASDKRAPRRARRPPTPPPPSTT